LGHFVQSGVLAVLKFDFRHVDCALVVRHHHRHLILICITGHWRAAHGLIQFCHSDHHHLI
jgi:hypothetical protein